MVSSSICVQNNNNNTTNNTHNTHNTQHKTTHTTHTTQHNTQQQQTTTQQLQQHNNNTTTQQQHNNNTTTPHNTAQHCTTLHNTAQHRTTPHNTAQHRTTLQHYNITTHYNTPHTHHAHHTHQHTPHTQHTATHTTHTHACSVIHPPLRRGLLFVLYDVRENRERPCSWVVHSLEVRLEWEVPASPARFEFALFWASFPSVWSTQLSQILGIYFRTQWSKSWKYSSKSTKIWTSWMKNAPHPEK